MADLAEWLFCARLRPGTRWESCEHHSIYRGDDAIGSPLVAVPAFRKLLLRLLADKTIAGKVREGGSGVTAIETSGKSRWLWGGSRSDWEPNDPRCPKKGTVVPFRECDGIAGEMGYLSGMTKIRLYWPQPRARPGRGGLRRRARALWGVL